MSFPAYRAHNPKKRPSSEEGLFSGCVALKILAAGHANRPEGVSRLITFGSLDHLFHPVLLDPGFS
jgi:hypothetical protein